jgi:hypothetical protein
LGRIANADADEPATQQSKVQTLHNCRSNPIEENASLTAGRPHDLAAGHAPALEGCSSMSEGHCHI